jgi:hypothetical protein
MSSQLGPIEIVCDAPAYGIVHACRELGFEMPEDVRWCQASHLPYPERPRRGATLVSSGMSESGAAICQCGQKLPKLELYTFQLLSGKELSYWLSQCPRCHAIVWELV